MLPNTKLPGALLLLCGLLLCMAHKAVANVEEADIGALFP